MRRVINVNRRHDAVGLWQRQVIEFEDGTADRSMRVFWGQTGLYFVDIRIPADRPKIIERDASALSASALAALSLQRGFSGTLTRKGNLFTWNRLIDYQPSTGRPDQGLVDIEANTLRERGTPETALGVSYTEIYERICPAENICAALTLDTHGSTFTSSAAPSNSVLIILDDRFMFARARATELPVTATGGMLSLIEEAKDDKRQITGILDCEISMGRLGKAGFAWDIDLSTMPWREGKRLFPRGAFIHQDGKIRQTTDLGDFLWTIEESTLSTADLVDLMQ
jgi:hypothetical protein